jgi:hydrogenase 3 maturation protease
LKKSIFSTAWKPRIQRDIQSARRILILGVGNPSKGDDAAGLLCASELKKFVRGRALSRLKILFGFESPENFTGKIRAFHPELVLILDAALGPHKPGTVFIVDKERIADGGVSTHNIPLAILVSYLEETIACRVTVLGIQPLILSPGADVSAPVKSAATRLAAHLALSFFP